MKIHNYPLSGKVNLALLAVLQVLLCAPVTAQTVSFESSMITASRVFISNPDFRFFPESESLKRKIMVRKVARLTPAFHQWQSDFELRSWSRHTGKISAPTSLIAFPSIARTNFKQSSGLNIKQRHFAEPIPSQLSASGLKVANFQSSWTSANRLWQVSAIITDPADERLFNNLSDLSAMGTDRLRQAPSRHLWLGMHRKF